jgi:hypothetical protein
MRIACIVVAAFALFVAAAPAEAQIVRTPSPVAPGTNLSDALPERPFRLTTASGESALTLRYQGQQTGRIVGSWRNLRIDGVRFVDASGERAAWVTYRENGPGIADDVPAHVFTAQYDAASASWFGAYYALDSAAGATPQRNGFGFRAYGLVRSPSICPGGPCPTPPVPANPAVTATPAPFDAPRLEWVEANGYPGMLYARVEAASGALSGRFLYDDMRGHYARVGGQAVFLRYLRGRPIQAYVGVLEANGSIAGQAYPVAVEGGAPAAFTWSIAHHDTLVRGLGSLRNHDCLDVANDASTPNALLVTAACNPSDAHQSWGLIRTTATEWQLVSMASGLCLSQPATGSPQYRLLPCTGTIGQRFIIHGAAEDPSRTLGWRLEDLYSATGLLTFPQFQFDNGSGGCPSITTQTGERVVLSGCFTSQDLRFGGGLATHTYWGFAN